MSYMRGDYYAYTGWCGDCSAADGCDECGVTLHGNASHCGCQKHDTRPSITLPSLVFDQLVVMRFAELLTTGGVPRIIASIANEGFGNFGTIDLANLCGFDPMEDWAREHEADVKAHLAECTAPESCDKPGIHRHRHKGRRVRT